MSLMMPQSVAYSRFGFIIGRNMQLLRLLWHKSRLYIPRSFVLRSQLNFSLTLYYSFLGFSGKRVSIQQRKKCHRLNKAVSPSKKFSKFLNPQLGQW